MIAPPTFAIVHDDDLALVQGDQCAAMLLSVMRYWNRYREWVEVTQDEMRVALKGIFSRNRVIAALKLLRENGFIATRSNPENRQTRTLQYQVVAIAQANSVEDTEHSTRNSESPVRNAENSVQSVSTLDKKESDSESWEESSPQVREGNESTQGDDDDDCPEVVRKEIVAIKAQIGATRTQDVLTRCQNAKARTWLYILTALRNERDQKRPSPSSAAPPPSAADYAKYALTADEMRQMHEGTLAWGWAGGAA